MKLYKAKLCRGDEPILIVELNKLEDLLMGLLGNYYANRIIIRIIKRARELGLPPHLVTAVYSASKCFISLEEDGTAEIEYGDKSESFYSVIEIGI